MKRTALRYLILGVLRHAERPLTPEEIRARVIALMKKAPSGRKDRPAPGGVR